MAEINIFTKDDDTSIKILKVLEGFKGDKGDKGAKGDKGDTGNTGNGISSIVKTATVGLVDTYTITFTDGTTTSFNVTNGEVSQAQLESALALKVSLTENETITGNKTFKGNVTINNLGASIELIPSDISGNIGGIIDFHYQGDSSVNYTSRIIENGNGVLDIKAPNGLKVNGNIIGFPNYNAGIDISSSIANFNNTYTALSNGYLALSFRTPNNQSDISIYINNNVVGKLDRTGTNDGAMMNFFLPVLKGDIFSFQQKYTGTTNARVAMFYPCK